MAAARAEALTPPAEGPPPQTPDWGLTLRDDAVALHALIIDNHPGPHDALNPGFRARADAALAVALARAQTTTDAGGWWWGLRALVASFDDGHVQVALTNPGAGFPTRWPGFLTAYRDGQHHVVVRDADLPSTPPEGARLLSCDGVAAATLAEQRIGAFRGRWFLESQRVTLGDWMFLSPSNPWITEMEACTFEVEGEPQVYALTWSPIAAEPLRAYRTPLAASPGGQFGMTRIAGGGAWITLPSFNGDPSSDAHHALTRIVSQMEADRDGLRAAPFVVLDLRGNGGGSSHWSREIARILWGEAWMRAHPPVAPDSIDWRASPGNRAVLKAYVNDWTARGESAERIAWAQNVADGMTAALAAGEPLWSDRTPASAPPAARPAQATERPETGPVYVLTDALCASACLDAIALWKPLGAIQIGRETSADTVYMDTRTDTLPGGRVRVTLPMKIWRGRSRGHNAPERPVHRFEGDIRDTDALQAWVRTLP
jgi:hypothetical protein